MELDPLGAFFLFPVLLMAGLGSIYGLRYWPQSEHPANGRGLRFFWGTLMAGLVVIILARNSILFLFAWEAMALSAFFLVGTEDHEPSVRDASWLYLVAAHVGTLSLFAMFALLHRITGSWDFRALAPGEAGLGPLTAIFALLVLGFGVKAGLMPFHVWLPSAHSNAPSHVSAVLSGIVLKIGIYGLVRFTGYLPAAPVSWGGLVLLLGIVSGILGVAFAVSQHDLKRLLAYHSVENIGIIVMGLGLGMLGRSLHRPEWILLGMAGCLLHVWNHALFKSLLFLGAGSVVHAMRTREIDRMGGLAKRMPATAFFFLVGAVAICGLPPLNGFVSEFLVFLGLFRTVGLNGEPSWSGAALGVPALAMIGALALACFVKVYGAVFLGLPRSDRCARAHESPASMIGPMAVLALACAAIGLAPSLVAPILDRAVAAWIPGAPPLPPLSAHAPLPWIGLLGGGLLALTGLSWILLRARLSRAPSGTAGTWDCGYARPTPRMQYTSSSFARTLVDLFRAALRPKVRRPRIEGLFPSTSHFESHVDDAVLDGIIVPALKQAKRRTDWLHAFQQGQIQKYVLYILVTLLVLILWVLPVDEFLRRIFTQ